MDRFDTRGKRIGAAIVDALIVWIFGIVFFFGGAAVLGAIDVDAQAYYLLAGLPSLAYYAGLHYFGGQTIGKMAFRVRVLDASEKPIGFGQALARSLPQLVLVMFGVAFLTAGAESQETVSDGYFRLYSLNLFFAVVDAGVFLALARARALHDLIAGTVVVRTDV